MFLPVSGRKYWYGIDINKFPKIFWTEMYYDVFRTLISEDDLLESDKFYRIINENAQELSIYLNSSLVALFREFASFMSLGDGVTKAPVYEVENLPVPKNLNSIKFRTNSKIFSRPIYSVKKEVKQKDRKDLDTAVLESLGLDPKDTFLKFMMD